MCVTFGVGAYGLTGVSRLAGSICILGDALGGGDWVVLGVFVGVLVDGIGLIGVCIRGVIDVVVFVVGRVGVCLGE